MSTLKLIDADKAQYFTVQNGRILDPGRYFGAPEYTPMFFGYWRDGLQDYTDPQAEAAMFWVGPDEIALYPDLAGFTQVVIYVTDQGQITAYPVNHLDAPN